MKIPPLAKPTKVQITAKHQCAHSHIIKTNDSYVRLKPRSCLYPHITIANSDLTERMMKAHGNRNGSGNQ